MTDVASVPDRCPQCAESYVARIYSDTSRQLEVPDASRVCIRGGDNPGEFKVYVHA